MASVEKQDGLRRVRPWIAALLTFVGWGLGAYYSGKTGMAVWLSIFQFVSGLLFGTAIPLLAFRFSIPPALIPNPDSITYVDGITMLASVLAALFVLVKVWPIRQATNRGLAGLPGYAALWAAPTLAVIGIALAVRTFIVQPFHIPSSAMQPTVSASDYVLVDKVQFLDKSAAPVRGEIIVFKNQRHNNAAYISRVIGMPGDIVMIVGGEVSINGEKISRQRESFNKDGSMTYRETLDNGTSYLTIDHGPGPLDNVGPYEVPKGHYFFISDNRDRAQDSRVTSMIGYVPHEHLLGPVMKIIPSQD